MSVAHQPVPEKKRKGIDAWLDERLHTGKAIDFVLNHPVPLHVHPLDYLGEITLFVFVSQAVTGMLLAMAYHPVAETAYYYCGTTGWQGHCPAPNTVTPSEAWQSITVIMSSTFGSLIRSMHFWGNYFMVVLVFMHMLRNFFTGAYKYPRELTWLSGVLLLLMTLGFAFTGYLMPWDQKAYWATQVGINIADTIPIIGTPIADLLRGGPLLTGTTLGRFFSIHMLLLPAITAGLIGLHVLLVNIQGISASDGLIVMDEEGTVLQQIPDVPEAAMSSNERFGAPRRAPAAGSRDISASTLHPHGSAPGVESIDDEGGR